MRAIQALALLAVGAWFGGMIVIAVVAATTFGEMRATGVDAPNAIAGKIMAANFTRFDYVQFACAAFLILWQTLRIILGRRLPREYLRLALVLIATTLTIYKATIMTSRILDLQTAAQSVDPDSAARVAFDQFHAGAVRIAQIVMLLILIIALEMGWTASTTPSTDRPRDSLCAQGPHP